MTVTIFYTTIPTKHQALLRTKIKFLMQVQKPSLLSVQAFYGAETSKFHPEQHYPSLKLFPMAASKQEPIKRVYFELEVVQGETVL